MKSFSKLSERQRNILRFMDRYFDQYGYPPTIREIGEATDIFSTSVVNYNLNKLVEHGFIERSDSKARGLRLIRKIPNGRNSVRKVEKGKERFPGVPLIGQIVAGEPIHVPEASYADDDNMIEVPRSFLGGVNPTETYALRVSGDSMTDAMIQDGDIVVLRHTDTAQNGDMVAVWLTDREETTLKYFYQEGVRVRLQPAHPTMKPIYVEGAHCRIQGKVLCVMRRVN